MTFGIAADLVRRALGDLLAVVEDGDPVADPHDHPHVVLDEQDRQARARARSRLIRSVICAVSRGFMPGGRLVEQQQRRVAGRGRGRSRVGAGRRRAGSWRARRRVPCRPTSASSSRARTRALPPRARSRRRRQQRIDQFAVSRDVHADEHVLDRRHVLEEPDVLERPARCRPRPCRSGGRSGRRRCGPGGAGTRAAGRPPMSSSGDQERPSVTRPGDDADRLEPRRPIAGRPRSAGRRSRPA